MNRYLLKLLLLLVVPLAGAEELSLLNLVVQPDGGATLNVIVDGEPVAGSLAFGTAQAIRAEIGDELMVVDARSGKTLLVERLEQFNPLAHRVAVIHGGVNEYPVALTLVLDLPHSTRRFCQNADEICHGVYHFAPLPDSTARARYSYECTFDRERGHGRSGGLSEVSYGIASLGAGRWGFDEGDIVRCNFFGIHVPDGTARWPDVVDLEVPAGVTLRVFLIGDGDSVPLELVVMMDDAVIPFNSAVVDRASEFLASSMTWRHRFELGEGLYIQPLADDNRRIIIRYDYDDNGTARWTLLDLDRVAADRYAGSEYRVRRQPGAALEVTEIAEVELAIDGDHLLLTSDGFIEGEYEPTVP